MVFYTLFESSKSENIINPIFQGGNVFSKKNSPKKNKNKIGRGRQTTTTPAPTTTTEEPTTTTINKRIQQQIIRARKVEIVDIFIFRPLEAQFGVSSGQLVFSKIFINVIFIIFTKFIHIM